MSSLEELSGGAGRNTTAQGQGLTLSSATGQRKTNQGKGTDVPSPGAQASLQGAATQATWVNQQRNPENLLCKTLRAGLTCYR